MNKYIGSKFRYLLLFLVIFISLSWFSKIVFFPDVDTLFGPITPGGLGFLIVWCLTILIPPNEEVLVDLNEKKVFSKNIRRSSHCISFAKVDIEKSHNRSIFDRLNFNYTIFGSGKKEKIVISGFTFGVKQAEYLHQEILEKVKRA